MLRGRGNVRRLRPACHFTSARKLGVGSAPMSACLDTIAAAPGVPAATPRIADACRVTCAVYSPSTITLTRVVAVKPSICGPAATSFVTVQIRLGVPGHPPAFCIDPKGAIRMMFEVLRDS
jgi:hypothetical protein